MWKAAFTGRSQRSESGSIVGSTSGHRERKKRSSRSHSGVGEDDTRSLASGASSKKHRSSGSRRERVRDGRPSRGLTESAIELLDREDDGDGGWEDEGGDDRRRRGEWKRRESWSRSRSQSRDGGGGKTNSKRRSNRASEIADTEEDHERGMPAMGSFEQSPDQYPAQLVRPLGNTNTPPRTTMSGALPSQYPAHQFPEQNPVSYTRPAFLPGPRDERKPAMPTRGDSFGAAADYYLDQGQSVLSQPGVSAHMPNMLQNTAPHLMTASAEANPAADTGHGAAAEFYEGRTAPGSADKAGKKGDKSSSGSDSRTRKSSGKVPATASSSVSAARDDGRSSARAPGQVTGEAASYYQPSNVSSMPPSSIPTSSVAPPSSLPSYAPPRRIRHDSEPVAAPGGGFYVPPPEISGRQNGKYPSNPSTNNPMYAAGAAAAGAAGLAAHRFRPHPSDYQSTHYSTMAAGSQYGSASQHGPRPPHATDIMQQQMHHPSHHQHEHRGPISRLKDGLLSLVSSPEDVRKMEEYTEYIGVCKYCFDPNSSPSQGPRKHYYSGGRRGSAERLRQKSSRDSLRRNGGRRIDKNSRYGYSSPASSSDDDERKSRKFSKTSIAGAGLAAAGAGLAANAIFHDGKGFDDTYSVKSGHRASSAMRRRSKSSSRERRAGGQYGSVRRSSGKEYVGLQRMDGASEGGRSQKSSSRERYASGALGAGAFAAGSVMGMQHEPPQGAFVHPHRPSSSSTDSSGSIHNPGLADIFGLTDRKAKRRAERRASPTSSMYNVARGKVPSVPGVLQSSPPRSDRRRKERKSGFFNFSNGSTSSSHSDLAFGSTMGSSKDGSRASLPRQRKAGRKNSDERMSAAMMGIGATAAALAAAQHKKNGRVSKRSSKQSSRARQHDPRMAQQDSSDGEWEDELPSDVDDVSSDGSGLAFGECRRLSGKQSMESLNSQSSAGSHGGLSAWGWRWGGKKDKKTLKRVEPAPAYPPRPAENFPDIAGSVGYGPPFVQPLPQSLDAPKANYAPTESVFSTNTAEPVQRPLQNIDPRPLSEASSTQPQSRHPSMSGAFVDDVPIVARPGPSPIQHPQPITPIPLSLMDDFPSTRNAFRPIPRRTQSSPVYDSKWTDAAMAGSAGIATASALSGASDRRSPGSVRFGLTDEQEGKDQKRRAEERRKEDRRRALEEEKDRVAREAEEDRRRAEEDERVKRENELIVRRERERMEYEAQLAREAIAREQLERGFQARRLKEREEKERAEFEREQSAKDFSEQRSRQSEDEDRHSSSSTWKRTAGAAGAAVAAAAGGTAIAGAMRDRDDDDRPYPLAREVPQSGEHRGTPYQDYDIYDPEFFKRKHSPSELSRYADLARKASDKVVQDMEARYHEPSPSQADFFYPRDVLSQPSEGKTRVADALGDNQGVQVWRVDDDVQAGDQVERDLVDDADATTKNSTGKTKGGKKNGGKKQEPQENHHFTGVPLLNVIEPTPPTSVAGSTGGTAPPSPLVQADDSWSSQVSEGATRPSSSGRSVSWGAAQTHEFEVRTPDSYQERDEYVSRHEVPEQKSLDDGFEVVVESPEEEASAGSTGGWFYQQSFAQTVSDLGFAVDSPGTEGAPPVRGFVEGETAETTPAVEREMRVPGGFDGNPSAVAAREQPEEDFSKLSKKERKKREKEIQQAEELAAFEREAAPANQDYAPAPEPEPEPELEPESAWEPPLSKKDKKKREKAAKRGESFDEPMAEVASPAPEERELSSSAGPQQPATEEYFPPASSSSKKDKKRKKKVAQQLDDFAESPAPGTQTPVEQTPPVDDAPRDMPMEGQQDLVQAEGTWEPPLSKKEKKREMAAKQRGLDDIAPEPQTPAYGSLLPGNPQLQPVETQDLGVEGAWEPPLSKKEKKKREKAAKQEEIVGTEPQTPADESPLPETPREQPAEQQDLGVKSAWEPPLSKKEKKKREKAAAKQGGFEEADRSEPQTPDEEPPVPESYREAAAEEQPAPATESLWQPPLSKKDKKKREKAAKHAGFGEFGESSPIAEQSSEPVVEPERSQTPTQEDAWEPPLSKKEKKKREKEQKAATEAQDKSLAASPPIETPHGMPGEWNQTPTEETSGQTIGDSHSKEVDPWAESTEPTKKSKKGKKKRDSERFNEPVASSPLRSEIAFDDYVGNSERSGDRGIAGSPRAMSPTGAQSVVSAPSGDSGRRKCKGSRSRRDDDYPEEGTGYDDIRSLAASEPADYESERKERRRRSKHEDEDASSRSRREKDESPSSAKNEKKGGLFGLFSRKLSDSVNKAEEPVEGERKHRKKKHRSGSEYGDDDTRSVGSGSHSRHRSSRDVGGEESCEHHRHHKSHRSGDDYDDARSAMTEPAPRSSKSRDGDDDGDDNRSPSVASEGRVRQHRRHRSGESAEDQSFLGGRVEEDDLPPLPPSAPMSPSLVAVEKRDEQGVGNSGSATGLGEEGKDVEVGEGPREVKLEAEAGGGGAKAGEGVDVAALPALPMSPTADMPETPSRPSMQPARPASSTAIPLRFRTFPHSPSSQSKTARSASFSAPVDPTSPSPTSPSSSAKEQRTHRPRSTEFRHSQEIRPLYLVERNRRPNDQQQSQEAPETLPSLPSSKPSSRTSSVQGSEDWQSAVEDQMPSPETTSRAEPLSIDTSRANAIDLNEDVLGSQQATPKAVEVGDPVTALSDKEQKDKGPKQEPQYWTWDDLAKEQGIERGVVSWDGVKLPPTSPTDSLSVEHHSREKKSESSGGEWKGVKDLEAAPVSPTDSLAVEHHSRKRDVGGAALAGALAGAVGVGLASNGGEDESKDQQVEPMQSRLDDVFGYDIDQATPEATTQPDIAAPAEQAQIPERLALSEKTSSKKGGKKGKKGKELPLGTTTVSDPDAADTLSAAEQRRLEATDVESAVDDWFSPAKPTEDGYRKKGKKGKKGSVDDTAVAQSQQSTPDPATEPATTTKGVAAESKETEDSSRQSQAPPVPQALLTRKQPKKGKKKGKSSSSSSVGGETETPRQPSDAEAGQAPAEAVDVDEPSKALEETTETQPAAAGGVNAEATASGEPSVEMDTTQPQPAPVTQNNLEEAPLAIDNSQQSTASHTEDVPSDAWTAAPSNSSKKAKKDKKKKKKQKADAFAEPEAEPSAPEGSAQQPLETAVPEAIEAAVEASQDSATEGADARDNGVEILASDQTQMPEEGLPAEPATMPVVAVEAPEDLPAEVETEAVPPTAGKDENELAIPSPAEEQVAATAQLPEPIQETEPETSKDPVQPAENGPRSWFSSWWSKGRKVDKTPDPSPEVEQTAQTAPEQNVSSPEGTFENALTEQEGRAEPTARNSGESRETGEVAEIGKGEEDEQDVVDPVQENVAHERDTGGLADEQGAPTQTPGVVSGASTEPSPPTDASEVKVEDQAMDSTQQPIVADAEVLASDSQPQNSIEEAAAQAVDQGSEEDKPIDIGNTTKTAETAETIDDASAPETAQIAPVEAEPLEPSQETQPADDWALTSTSKRNKKGKQGKKGASSAPTESEQGPSETATAEAHDQQLGEIGAEPYKSSERTASDQIVDYFEPGASATQDTSEPKQEPIEPPVTSEQETIAEATPAAEPAAEGPDPDTFWTPQASKKKGKKGKKSKFSAFEAGPMIVKDSTYGDQDQTGSPAGDGEMVAAGGNKLDEASGPENVQQLEDADKTEEPRPDEPKPDEADDFWAPQTSTKKDKKDKKSRTAAFQAEPDEQQTTGKEKAPQEPKEPPGESLEVHDGDQVAVDNDLSKTPRETSEPEDSSSLEAVNQSEDVEEGIPEADDFWTQTPKKAKKGKKGKKVAQEDCVAFKAPEPSGGQTESADQQPEPPTQDPPADVAEAVETSVDVPKAGHAAEATEDIWDIPTSEKKAKQALLEDSEPATPAQEQESTDAAPQDTLDPSADAAVLEATDSKPEDFQGDGEASAAQPAQQEVNDDVWAAPTSKKDKKAKKKAKRAGFPFDAPEEEAGPSVSQGVMQGEADASGLPNEEPAAGASIEIEAGKQDDAPACDRAIDDVPSASTQEPSTEPSSAEAGSLAGDAAPSDNIAQTPSRDLSGSGAQGQIQSRDTNGVEASSDATAEAATVKGPGGDTPGVALQESQGEAVASSESTPQDSATTATDTAAPEAQPTTIEEPVRNVEEPVPTKGQSAVPETSNEDTSAPDTEQQPQEADADDLWGPQVKGKKGKKAKKAKQAAAVFAETGEEAQPSQAVSNEAGGEVAPEPILESEATDIVTASAGDAAPTELSHSAAPDANHEDPGASNTHQQPQEAEVDNLWGPPVTGKKGKKAKKAKQAAAILAQSNEETEPNQPQPLENGGDTALETAIEQSASNEATNAEGAAPTEGTPSTALETSPGASAAPNTEQQPPQEAEADDLWGPPVTGKKGKKAKKAKQVAPMLAETNEDTGADQPEYNEAVAPESTTKQAAFQEATLQPQAPVEPEPDDFWATPAKGKKGKKGKKSKQDTFDDIPTTTEHFSEDPLQVDIAAAEPAASTKQVPNEENKQQDTFSEQPAGPADPEGEDFWSAPTKGKKGKKRKKIKDISFEDTSLVESGPDEGEAPTASGPEDINVALTTNQEPGQKHSAAIPEASIGDQAAAVQATSSDPVVSDPAAQSDGVAQPEQPSQNEVQADDSWTAPTKGKKGKKSKKGKQNFFEDEPASSEVQQPHTSQADEQDNSLAPVHEASGAGVQAEPSAQEAESKDEWGPPTTSKKGKKAKKRAQMIFDETSEPNTSQAEEPLDVEPPTTTDNQNDEVAASAEPFALSPLDTTDHTGPREDVVTASEGFDEGIQQASAFLEPDKPDVPFSQPNAQGQLLETPQEDPTATGEDFWAAPTKSKKNKKGKKSKESAGFEDPPPANDESQTTFEAAASEVREEREATNFTEDANFNAEFQASNEAAVDDIWAMPTTTEKGKKGKKGKQTASEQNQDEVTQASDSPKNASETTDSRPQDSQAHEQTRSQPQTPAEAGEENLWANPAKSKMKKGKKAKSANTQFDANTAEVAATEKLPGEGQELAADEAAAQEGQDGTLAETTQDNSFEPKTDDAAVGEASSAQGLQEDPDDSSKDAVVTGQETLASLPQDEQEVSGTPPQSTTDYQQGWASTQQDANANGQLDNTPPDKAVDLTSAEPADASAPHQLSEPAHVDAPGDAMEGLSAAKPEQPVEDESSASFDIKKSKKDKKKAKKKQQASPADEAQDIKQAEPTPNADCAIPQGESESQMLQTPQVEGTNMTMAGALTEVQPAEDSAIQQEGAAEAAPQPEQEQEADLFPVSTKKSKKDKKKAKENFSSREEPETIGEGPAQPESHEDIEAAQNQATAPQEESHLEVTHMSDGAQPVNDASKTTVAEEAPPSAQPGPEAETYFPIPAKKSKKDKKKAKKGNLTWNDAGNSQGQNEGQTPAPGTVDDAVEPSNEHSSAQTEEHRPDVAHAKTGVESLEPAAKPAEAHGVRESTAPESQPEPGNPDDETFERAPDTPAIQYAQDGVPVAAEPEADPEAMFPVSTKKSKTDKKKGKKSQAFQDEPAPESETVAEEATAAAPAEEVPPEGSTTVCTAEAATELTAADMWGPMHSKKSKKAKKKAARDLTLAEEPLKEPEKVQDEAPAENKIEDSASGDTTTENAAQVAVEPEADELWGAAPSKNFKKDKKKGKKGATPTFEVPTNDNEPTPTTQVADEAQSALQKEVNDAPEPISSTRETVPTSVPEMTSNEAIGELDDKEPANAAAGWDEARDISCDAPEELEPAPTAATENAPNSSQDIDFAATLAAGLSETGFDPSLVVEDPAFHRRQSPPNATAEADPEEAFPTATSKKGKKGKRGKKAQKSEAQPEGASAEANEDLPSKPQDDFDDVLAQGLQSGGFDSAMLKEAGSASRENESFNEITGEKGDFSFAQSKRKKGKKGKQAEFPPQEDQPAPEPGFETPSQAQTTTEPAEQNEPDLDMATEIDNAHSVGESVPEPTAWTSEQMEATQPADVAQEPESGAGMRGAGEDEWTAPTKKKKGKKGKKNMEPKGTPATTVGEEARDMDPAPANNERSVEQMQVPSVPTQDLATADASMQGAAPDDWAVPIAKKKGKKKDKQVEEEQSASGVPQYAFDDNENYVTEPSHETEASFQPDVAALSESAPSEPQALSEEMNVGEMDQAYKAYKKNKRNKKKLKALAAQSGDTTEAEPSGSMPQSAVPEGGESRALQDDAMQPQEYIEPPINDGPDQSTEAIREGPPSSLSSPTSTSKVQSLFPGLQRVKRRTPSGNEPTRPDILHTSEVSQSLPAAGEHTPDQAEKYLEPAYNNQPGWSFDNLARVPEQANEALSTEEADWQVARDSGYQEESVKHYSTESAAPIASGLRQAASHGSLRERRSQEPLHLGTDNNGQWNDQKSVEDAQKRSRNMQASDHRRTPSGNAVTTPLEPTTKNRASYLFQSPQAGLRENELSATPRESARSMENDLAQNNTSEGMQRDQSMFSPPPGPMSPRTPLGAISEERPSSKSQRKRSKPTNDIGSPAHDSKASKHHETPEALRDQSFSPLHTPNADSHIGPPHVGNHGWAANAQNRIAFNNNSEVGDTDRSLQYKPSRRAVSDQRSPSAMSNQSSASTCGGGGGYFRQQDELRSFSRTSNRSLTPSLRRMDRSTSGDLRAAARRSDAGSAVGARSSPKTNANPPFEPPPTPPLQDDEEVANRGASRAPGGMTDVYQGYGDASGSQVSPTRPPSMRKRQSMHIMDLESKMEQLVEENRALHEAQQSSGQGWLDSNNGDSQALQQALDQRDLEIQERDDEIARIKMILEPMQAEIDRLNEINGGLTEANKNLVDDTNGRYGTLQQEHAEAHKQWQNANRELEAVRQENGRLTAGMRGVVEQEIQSALSDKNTEIRRLREELQIATERIRSLQVQIQGSKSNDFLAARDEDYFDGACQKLCQHAQQWVLRFSKLSDNRICRLSSDLKDDKIEARLDNAILDGSDVDKLLGDRVRRRDVFMSVLMTMIWEYVFTRYLFGMDREQRQKLKALEKILAEVGPPRAVAQWRATTLTLLSKRPAFSTQCALDTEAVANEIFSVLCSFLPPPSPSERQLLESLQKVVTVAVNLSIEMRTQRAEFIMLPPLQPEYDTNGDLVRKVHFNASLMNERSGHFSSNEQLESERAIVKIVLFPLVVKKGDESGEGDEEIVVCPAQVLVHNDGGKGRKVVRVMSGAMEIDSPRRSRQSLVSTAMGEGGMQF